MGTSMSLLAVIVEPVRPYNLARRKRVSRCLASSVTLRSRLRMPRVESTVDKAFGIYRNGLEETASPGCCDILYCMYFGVYELVAPTTCSF